MKSYWSMKSLKGTSPWPRRTISVTNQKAPMTARQRSFAHKLVKTVDAHMNVKNRY